jgi:uncharacterized protein (TIGR02147 family)
MSLRVFDFTDYKQYLHRWVKTRPSGARGEMGKMAQAMRMQTSQLSQVTKGERQLNLEQADLLADHLQFGGSERQYFFDLILYARAGSKRLQNYYQVRLRDQRREADKLKNRLKAKRQLSDAQKAIFYADPIYSLVQLLTHLPDARSVEEIAKRLKRDPTHIREVVDFLLSAELLQKTPEGLVPGVGSTHVEADSAYVLMHHRNWRLQALQKQSMRDSSDLFYTGQMSMSEADFERCKEILRETLEQFYKIIAPSPSEEVYGFNFDFFRIEN